jgi:hypothetical protein
MHLFSIIFEQIRSLLLHFAAKRRN